MAAAGAGFCPADSCTILTPALAPTRVAPAATIAFNPSRSLHAACGLDAHAGADDAPHQRHVGGRGTTGSEAGRRLHEIGAGRLGQGARGDLLVVSQQCRLDDHLAEDAALAACFDHGDDIALHRPQVPGLERADVDHHVDLGRAVENRPPRLVVLDVGVVAPRGNPTTEQTPTPVPRSSAAAVATHAGLTHTVAKWNSAASRQSFSISPRDASGLSSVWSIIDDTPIVVLPLGVHAEPSRAGIDHAAQAVGAAV